MDIRILYLVRDPRGLMSSRWQLRESGAQWCSEPFCTDTRTVCEAVGRDLRQIERCGVVLGAVLRAAAVRLRSRRLRYKIQPA